MPRADRGSKFREGRIPKGVIGNQQPAWLNMVIGSAIFPKHVIVGMQAVVDEDVNRSQSSQDFRQKGLRVANPERPTIP